MGKPVTAARRRRPLPLRVLAAALLAPAAVTGVKLAFGDSLGREAPFALFALGVLVAGYMGGWAASLVATVALSVANWFLFLRPIHAPGASSSALQLMTFFGEGLAIIAIVRAMQHARGREAISLLRLEELGGLNSALSAALTLDEVASVVVTRGAETMGADTCTLYILDESEGSLELLADAGVAPQVLDRIRRISSTSDSPVFATLESKQPLWVETERDYQRTFPAVASIVSSGPRAKAFWSVPLIVEGKPTGLLGMGFYQERRFAPDERRFIETFTGACAQAVRRAQRWRAEQRARLDAERAQGSLTTTLRSIGDAVIATDKEARVTFMNQIAEQLTGWSAADARGRPVSAVFRIVNEQTRQTVESPVERVLREGVVVGLANHTVLLGLQAGMETPIDDSGAPIRDELGDVQGVVLVFRDVRAKKDEEARRAFLVEASSLLASSLDHQETLTRVAEMVVPRLADWCAVDLVDPKTALPQRLAVTHVDPAKVQLAHEVAKRFPESPDAPGGLPKVLRTGQAEFVSVITEEMIRHGARNPDHLRILLDLQLRSVMIVPLVARGRTLGAITFVAAESGRTYSPIDLAFAEDLARRAAIAIDNAHLYKAEQQARHAADVANRTKDDFLATVSHELRNPLNAILGWARLMASRNFDEAKRQRAIETVERNAVAMSELIEDLLDVSRIISGQLRLDVRPIDLAGVAQQAIESVRPAIDAKEIQFKAEITPDLATTVGDPTRLQQVMWNLLSNAVKFTPKGGQVTVALRRKASSIELSVTDSGKGIDQAFLPHVFDPFRQADATIRRAHGGLGLGLAITRHLVELHGGQIEARSEGEGKGASFVVLLPVSAIRHQPARPSEQRDPVSPTPPFERPSSLVGLDVLVVDDEEDARQLVRTVLEECGSVVRSASNVPDALAAIGEAIPDVLISDLGMPIEDGYSLIQKVRALPAARGGNLPAVALTAYTRGEDRRAILNAGFSMHVPKPVEPAELVTVIASLARLTQPGTAES